MAAERDCRYDVTFAATRLCCVDSPQVGAGWALQRNPGAFVVKEVLPMGLAVVVALAVWAVWAVWAVVAVVAVVAVGAGQPGASAAIGAWVNRQVVHRFPLG
jgi:hypothetical protein